MSANSRTQRCKRVKSMPSVESSIEAWPSETIDHRERARSKSPVVRRTNPASDLTSTTYSSISKPLPPAHRVAPSMPSKQIYQPTLELHTVPIKHQGDTMNRFRAAHPRRIDGVDGFRVKEIMRIDPLHFFFTGFIPPFLGAVVSIIVALLLHNDEISNYNWQCGRARLPSLSRIINLPMERIFWQFSFLFHVPLRMLELSVGFVRYGRLRSVDTRFPRIYTLSRYLYAIIGVLELVFMVALSVVGEREFISYHVIFFYAFGLCAIGFFLTNLICHANSLYYLNPYGRLSYYIKFVVLVLYIISVPILLGAFLMYWKKCITYMYDIFALMEYTDVFLSIVYHCCAYFDIRHKVIFSIRNVKRVKYE